MFVKKVVSRLNFLEKVLKKLKVSADPSIKIILKVGLKNLKVDEFSKYK